MVRFPRISLFLPLGEYISFSTLADKLHGERSLKSSSPVKMDFLGIYPTMNSYGFFISPLLFPISSSHLTLIRSLIRGHHWYEYLISSVTVFDLFFLHKTLFPILATIIGCLLSLVCLVVYILPCSQKI